MRRIPLRVLIFVSLMTLLICSYFFAANSFFRNSSTHNQSGSTFSNLTARFLLTGTADQSNAHLLAAQLNTDNIVWLPFLQANTNTVVIPLRLAEAGAGNNAVQLLQKKSAALPTVVKELADPRALALQYTLYEQTITVVHNKKSLIPFQNLDTLTFASLAVGHEENNYFQEYLSKYAPFTHFTKDAHETDIKQDEQLLNALSRFKVVVIGLHDVNSSALQAYGVSQNTRTFIERLRTKTHVVLAVFGTPYSLKYFNRMDHLVCAYENNSLTQQLVPQILFGAIPAMGKLPVTVTAELKAGMGHTTASLHRLAYSIPERVGLRSAVLQRIDRMVENYIQDEVMPGAQVLIAKKGKVIFDKAYGHLMYDKQTPVTTHTLYDLASVTKVAATLQAVMALHGKGVLNINEKASHYLPELQNTNKEGLLIRDLLLHQAGLLAFQDHWTKTRSEDGLDSLYYSASADDLHTIMVATGLYGIPALKDSLWQWTIQSRLLKKTHRQKKYAYKYSDLGFDILQQIVERIAAQPLDEYLSQNFYRPLGLDELTFNPLRKFSETNIAPTELDNRFRGKLVRGTVHDQTAALMGGVAGHAGLFGTANDLAVLMQMNLQHGFYGGRQYLTENTIPAFTKAVQADNHRALGWDRIQPGAEAAAMASDRSFGHTGFTGTCVWVDPDEELIYIFLSNRVYPVADNTKLARYKVREKIQKVIYTSMGNPESLVAGLE